MAMFLPSLQSQRSTEINFIKNDSFIVLSFFELVREIYFFKKKDVSGSFSLPLR